MGRIATYKDLGCLVTGASSGIGRDIARLLAKEGARIVVTARRLDRLEALVEEMTGLGAGAAFAVQGDLARPEEVERIASEAEAHLGHVDVLVNNAGFSVPGLFARTDLGRTLDMIQVNVAAAIALTHRLLEGMVRRDKGGVLTVSSVAGYQAAPYQSGYAGTKAFLLNFSDSMHHEYSNTNVAITALCPGVTDTEFFRAAGYKNITAMLKHRMPSEKVARVGLAGLRKGKMEVVPGALNKTLVFAQRLFTRNFVAAVSRRLMGGRRRNTPANNSR